MITVDPANSRVYMMDTLRHSFGTSLMPNGVEAREAKVLPGRSDAHMLVEARGRHADAGDLAQCAVLGGERREAPTRGSLTGPRDLG